jgi:hypothetical protein
MKKLLFITLFALAFASSKAQTGISAAGTAPDASAMLDVIATDKGFLAPRIALTTNSSTAAPITSPANGLLIFNTATVGDVTPGFYYWSTATSSWQRVAAGTGSNLFTAGTGLSWSGNTLNSVWTVNGTHIYNNNAGNVGIGVTNPTSSKLQVAGFVSGDDGSGRFATKFSGDNHHGIWYRATISADGATTTTADAITFREYGSSSLGYHFWTGGTTMTERFRITNDYASFLTGNVGIANSAPADRLHISRDWFDNSTTDWGGGIRLSGTSPTISFWETDDGAHR